MGSQTIPRNDPWTLAYPNYRVWKAVLIIMTVGVITGLGALLRLHGLAQHSLWLDEGVSVWESQKALPELALFLANRDFHPPLYFSLLHAVMQIDDSVTGIRMVSVVASVLTIPTLYALGKRLYGEATGVLAALLLAISPFNVYYAQEARNYALFGLTASLSSYLLICGLQTEKRKTWVWYACASILMLYSNTVGIFITVTHGLILVIALLSGRERRWTGLWAICASVLAWTPWIILAGLARWIPQIIVPTSSSSGKGGGGGGLAWIQAPTPSDLNKLVLSFTSYLLPEPGVGTQGWIALLPTYLVPVVVVVFLVVVILGILTAKDRVGGIRAAGWLFAFPVILHLGASMNSSLFIDRALLPESIMFSLLLAAGMIRLATRKYWAVASLAIFIMLLSLNTASLINYYNYYQKEKWDSGAAIVAQQGRPGDAIMFVRNSSQFPFDYYYTRAASVQLPKVGVPCDAYTCRRWDSRPHEDDQARIADQLSQYRRVWVVKRTYGNDDFHVADAVGDAFANRFNKIGQKRLYGVQVTLYEIESRPEVSNLNSTSGQ